jgi:hypothetical protein
MISQSKVSRGSEISSRSSEIGRISSSANFPCRHLPGTLLIAQ